MSRELKFRAWDGKNMYDRVLPFQWDFVLNAMAHKCVKTTGSGILGSGGDTATFEIEGYRFTHIMQYTGLKDKNGKEIYEMDIVSGTNGLYAFVVTYIRNSFIAVSTDGRDEFTIPDHWEVIGNIHQDKHLLS